MMRTTRLDDLERGGAPDQGETILIEWQPGNGTRYPIAITRLPLGAELHWGGPWLVTLCWTGGRGRSSVIAGPDFPPWFVGQELGLRLPDAEAVAPLLDWLLSPPRAAKTETQTHGDPHK